MEKIFELKTEIIESKTSRLYVNSNDVMEEVANNLKSKNFKQGSFYEKDFATITHHDNDKKEFYIELYNTNGKIDKMLSYIKSALQLKEQINKTTKR